MKMSNQSKLREELWYGVPFKQALQDVVSRGMVGFAYDEFVAQIKNDDEMGDEEDLESIDAMVNILMHLFVFYHGHRPESPREIRGE